MVGDPTLDLQLAPRDRGREDPGAGHDPVRDGPVLDGLQLLDPLDHQGGRGDPVDAGAHGPEHLAQVDDLRLPGDVVDHGGALGEHGRHHEVLRGPDRGEVQPQVGPDQALGHLGDDLPVLDAYDGPQLLQPADVHVQAAGPDRVSTGQGDAGLATSGDERTQHRDRCPEAAYELVGGLVVQLVREPRSWPDPRWNHWSGPPRWDRRCRRCSRAGAAAGPSPRRRGCRGRCAPRIARGPAGRPPSASGLSSWRPRRTPSRPAAGSADPRRRRGSCPCASL